MSKEKQIDYKAYARQMRENCVRDHNGTEPIVICSLELWEEIATIIERFGKQSEGEWVAKTDYAGYGYYCSNCNAVFTGENAEWIAKEHHYCPKCGAKMRKEDEGK